MHRQGHPASGLIGALGVMALLFCAAAGHAAAPGDSVSFVLDLAGKQVPLPRGAWEIAGIGVQPASGPDSPYGVVRSAILLQRDGDQVRALLEVNTNDIAVNAGWVAPCGNDPLPPERRLRYRSQYDASCAETALTRPDAAGPPAWQQARAAIEQARLHLPETLQTAMALSADREGFLEVRVHLRAVPGADAAARQRALLDWATLYASLLDEGLSRRIGGLVLDWPGRAVLLQDQPVLDRRLLRIEAMRRNGAITPAEASAQEAAVVQQVPMSAVDPHPRPSLWARISAPLVNLGTAYSVTRDVPLSVGIAASEYVAYNWLASANDDRWEEIQSAVMPQPLAMPELRHLGTPVVAEETGLLGLAKGGFLVGASRGQGQGDAAPAAAVPGGRKLP